MNAHRIETRLNENGTLLLRDLPFQAGAAVEVIVLEAERSGTVSSLENGAPASTREAKNGDAAQENGESWVEAFSKEVNELWQREGERPDIPRDFAATWKQEKGRRIMERNQQP